MEKQSTTADGAVEINVSPDGMQAFMGRITPPGANGKPITAATVEQALRNHGINFGLDKSAISQSVEAIASGTKMPLDLALASGVAPEAGKNARIKFFFKTDRQVGSIDEKTKRLNFKERHTLENVKAGSLLAEIEPATPGTDGRDVRGRSVPAQPGQPVMLASAGNVSISKDGLQFHSDIDGMVTLVGHNAIGVFKQYTVKGDVDYSTGNLIMDGSLEIHGWIRSGFSVLASGDIHVTEGIENARVEAGGNLSVSGGILGRGESLVRAGGHVSVRFMENVLLKAGGDIEVKETILNSKADSRGGIRVLGGRGQIIGGTIVSDIGITAGELGSKASVRTSVVVGPDPKAYKIASLREKTLAFKRRRSAKARRSLVKSGKPPRKIPPDSAHVAVISQLGKLKRTTVLKEMKLEKFRSKFMRTGEEFDQLKAIRVMQRVFKGTSVIVKGHRLDVEETLSRPGTFVLNPEKGHLYYLS